MIVACPECSGPFELRDGDIAELVQLECPHCQFRMILDFAAANDQRLVEPGMRMASGYRSAAEYRRASSATPEVARVATPAATARPAATAVPTPVADERPAPHAAASRATSSPATSSPATMRPAEARGPAEAARTPVTTHAAVAAAGVNAPARSGGTAVGPTPMRPAASAEVALPPTEPARKRADGMTPGAEPAPAVAPARTAEAARAEPLPRVEPRAPIRPAEPRADARIPPHTPPGPKPATSPQMDSGAMAMDIDAGDSGELDRPRTSTFGAVMLVVLVLLATALTIASVVRKDTPDPRPLLEDIYRNMRG